MPRKYVQRTRNRRQYSGRFLVLTIASLLVALGVSAATSLAASLKPDETILVSRASGPNGAVGDGLSFTSDISGNGNTVVFASISSNLIPADDGQFIGIFMRDIAADTTTSVSPLLGVNDEVPNEDSLNPAVSCEGDLVVYSSSASNLVDNDDNGSSDIFLYDAAADTTALVSSAAALGDDDSFNPAISCNGRFIAYESDATNLDLPDTNGLRQIFLYDLQEGVTTMVSVNNDGEAGNANSLSPKVADNGDVTFSSAATNLPNQVGFSVVYVHNFGDDTTEAVSLGANLPEVGFATFPDISSDGRYVSFEHDSSLSISVIFVYDRDLGTTTLVSRADGASGAPADRDSFRARLSDEGPPTVVFQSEATNMGVISGGSNIYLRDLKTSETVLINRASGPEGVIGTPSALPAISGDGCLVSFTSEATNLVPDTDSGSEQGIYVRQTCQLPPVPAPVTPVPPPPAASAVGSGSASEPTSITTKPVSVGIHGPVAGCRTRAFTVRVTGARINRVTFTLDGKRVTSTGRSVRINPSKLSVGSHRVRARVVFNSDTGASSRVVSYRFTRCAARVIDFAG